MMNADSVMGVMPTYQLNEGDKRNGFLGGDSSILWIFLLFLLFGFGRHGGFGGSGVDGGVGNMVNNDFLYTQTKIDSLRQELTGQTTAINQTINTGFNQVGLNLCNLGHQIDTGFCSINRNIDQVRAEANLNVCTITNATRDEGSKTRDLINANTMQELRDRLNEAQINASNAQQTNAIVGALRPYPVPAYAV